MYEFRGVSLQDAVHQALQYPDLSTKKLAKVAAKFDFTARLRMGGVLFVGEGNLSFAMTMSRKPRVPASSIMQRCTRKAGFATPAIYTFDPKDYPGYTHQNTANEESAADGHTAFATFVFSG